jgi:multidrug efflux system outer membrane protein
LNVFTLMRVASVLPVLVLVSSCTFGPNYRRPAVELPDAYRGAAAEQRAGRESLADLQWFEVFGDDTLTELVKAALARNFELRIAAERVLQARAVFGIARAQRFPEVSGTAGAVAARGSEVGANRGVPRGAETDVTYVEAGFALAWELDVWGRIRRLNEAARARYLATEEARRGVITTLVADVTETYLALRALDLELEIARRTRDLAGESLRLVEARRSGGAANGLDVRQAEQLLFTATGQIAGLEREIAQAENALTLLLGRVPGEVPRGRPLEAFQAPPRIPAGLPASRGSARRGSP